MQMYLVVTIDEYVPDRHTRRTCGIYGCAEDIFLGCLNCPNFLCYDHIQTTCDVHNNSKELSVLSEDTDDMEFSSDSGEKPVNRKRIENDMWRWKKIVHV